MKLSGISDKGMKRIAQEQKQFGITDDGWDVNDLEEIGLIDLFDEVEKVIYEIKNARRGSYAGFGDTTDDLVTKLQELSREFEGASTLVFNYSD